MRFLLILLTMITTYTFSYINIDYIAKFNKTEFSMDYNNSNNNALIHLEGYTLGYNENKIDYIKNIAIILPLNIEDNILSINLILDNTQINLSGYKWIITNMLNNSLIYYSNKDNSILYSLTDILNTNTASLLIETEKENFFIEIDKNNLKDIKTFLKIWSYREKH